MTDELPREPWAVDVTLLIVLDVNGERVNAEYPLLAASWMQTGSGWQLGGLLRAATDLSRIRALSVVYPDRFVETLMLAEPLARHARTGDPRGVFSTLHITGEPTWTGAVAQHEAMLQELRDEGFTIEGDEEPEEFASATCRPVTLESGETVPVLGDEPLSARGVAALAELIEAARAKHAAENPPDEGAPELFERIEAARGDRSLRECARLAGVRFAVLFRIRQGRMPGAQDPAAIEAWLAAQDETTNTQEGTS